MTIERALVSVSDKSGLADFIKEVAAMGVEILSTGGTARTLREAGIAVTDVSDYTGHPEIMDGRVKTLHPRVHGGLLAVRDNAEHRRAMTDNGIKPIDMVVVNLYPFEQTVAKPDCAFEDAIENIDIGGPSMVRSAAKNHRYVAIVTDPADYARVLGELKSSGEVSDTLRSELALKAFKLTAHYDTAISAYLESRSR